MKSAILVVDDDTAACTFLQGVLSEHVFTMAAYRAGQEALCCIEAQPDTVLISLDMMLSDINGLMVLQRVQKMKPGLPAAMLTGLSSRSGVVVGLETGADDCIGKPSNVRALVTRVKAVLRRVGVLTAESGDPQTTGLSFDGQYLDTAGCQLHNSQQLKAELTQGEYSLLLMLAQDTRRVLSWEQLLELTRSDSVEVFDRIIDVLIMRLQREVENNLHQPMLIKTLHGLGYVFAANMQHHDKAA